MPFFWRHLNLLHDPIAWLKGHPNNLTSAQGEEPWGTLLGAFALVGRHDPRPRVADAAAAAALDTAARHAGVWTPRAVGVRARALPGLPARPALHAPRAGRHGARHAAALSSPVQAVLRFHARPHGGLVLFGHSAVKVEGYTCEGSLMQASYMCASLLSAGQPKPCSGLTTLRKGW